MSNIRGMLIMEEFKRGEGKKSLGVGIYSKREFGSLEETADFLIRILPAILKTDKIPSDIIMAEKAELISWKYFKTILSYVEKYIEGSSTVLLKSLFEILSKKLEDAGFERQKYTL